MKQQFQLAAKTLMLTFAFIFFQSFSGRGGDYYKVLLNGKLVAEQYLTHPLALKTLSLTSANENDRLVFYYSHCGQAGTGRSIALKAADGKVLKQWKFNDTNSPAMQLSVKEVLQPSSKASVASVYYTSKEIPAGKMLITLNLSTTVLAKR